jgi:hypothetical protein
MLCGLKRTDVYRDILGIHKETKVTYFLKEMRTVHNTTGREYQKLPTESQPTTAVHVESFNIYWKNVRGF